VAEVRFVVSAVHTVLGLLSYLVGSKWSAFRSVILYQEALIALR
jgi:hypothetical protein